MDSCKLWKERFQILFDQYSEWDLKKLIFWGAGSTAEIWWEDFAAAGIVPRYWVDTYKEGESFNGFDIIDPAELTDYEEAKDCSIVVFTTNPFMYETIRCQILNMGIKKKIYTCSAIYFSLFKKNLLQMAETLSDEKSRRNFYELLSARLEGRLMNEDLIDHRHYFSLYHFSVINKNEVFVDAGAYAGDTLEKFLFEKFGTFKFYYAFEPFEESYIALTNRVARLEKEWGGVKDKIICEKLALDKASKTAWISPSAMPVGAVVRADVEHFDLAQQIRAITVDEYFKGEKVTTIKADIEGKELDMLLGAQETIKNWKPHMAVSIYHKPSDMFRIFEKIQDLDSSYRFAVRCHAADGNDTVLYAF